MANSRQRSEPKIVKTRSGGYDLGETKDSLRLRRAGRLAEFFFYGGQTAGLDFKASFQQTPNALGVAVLSACERLPDVADPNYDLLVREIHTDLLQLPEAKGIKSLEEMEGLFMGWSILAVDHLRSRLDDGWLAGKGLAAEQLRHNINTLGLELTYGIASVEMDQVMKNETAMFLDACSEWLRVIGTEESAVGFVYEARILGLRVAELSSELENAFLARLGRTSNKLGSGTDNWNRICFLYWRVSTGLADKEIEFARVFPGEYGFASEKWKEVPKLFRELREAVSKSSFKPTLLGKSFTPYLLHRALAS